MAITSQPRHPELVSGSITGTARRQGRKAKVTRKVAPVGVRFLDKVDLPLSAPVLDLLLARDGLVHRGECLMMHKPKNSMFAGEALGFAVAMLPNALRQVRGCASVKRSAIAACQNVDEGFTVAIHNRGCDWRWTSDQVRGDGRSLL